MKALQAGYAFGETTETFAVTYEIKPAKRQPGTYRNITGNQALSLGLVAASRLSGLPLFLGAYPITPASAILEELAGYKHFGVRTFQAEDEIAAAGAAVGAAFGGSLAVTTSAGPGVVLGRQGHVLLELLDCGQPVLELPGPVLPLRLRHMLPKPLAVEPLGSVFGVGHRLARAHVRGWLPKCQIIIHILFAFSI